MSGQRGFGEVFKINTLIRQDFRFQPCSVGDKFFRQHEFPCTIYSIDGN